MKKVALISDIHGNYSAFRSVINDAEEQNVSEYWFLGDLLMPGPGTNSIMKLLNSVNTTQMIRGNWDNFLFEDIVSIGKEYLQEPQTPYIIELIKYVTNHLDSKYLQQIKDWPIASQTSLSGLKILLAHNYPSKNYGHELLPYEKQENFDKLLFSKPYNDYDMAIYGHTHHQVFRTSSNDQLIINPGSIGQPYTAWSNLSADRRAQYTIITFDDTGYGGIDFRKVSYSIKDELDFAAANDLPFIELYKKIFTDGKAFTHNDAALNKIIDKYDYRTDALKYINKIALFGKNM